jgi:hypothetical protein
MSISKFRRLPALALMLVVTGSAAGQWLVDNASDPLIVTGPWADPAAILFRDRVQPWTSPLVPLRGLHIRNGQSNVVYSTLAHETYSNSWSVRDSVQLGVQGAGTEVVFRGQWVSDTNPAYPYLSLTDGGRFVLTGDARIDLIQNAGSGADFYTRQLWVYGDGTGELEIEEGFVADRTQGGTVTEGMGAIRLRESALITHHSQSLPMGTRPWGPDGPYPNGHLVFEDAPGGCWSVRTRPQSYAGAVWMYESGTIDAQTDLELTGENVVDLVTGYNTYGGLHLAASGIALTKTGQGTLHLRGAVACAMGTQMDIQQGAVHVHTDPADGPIKGGGTFGPYLNVRVAYGAAVRFAAPRAGIQSASVEPGGLLDVRAGASLQPAAGVQLAGVLTGTGTIDGNVACWGGELHPGPADVAPPGRLAVTGDVTLDAASTVHIDLAGEQSDEIDGLDIGGTLHLAGRLIVQPAAEYAPEADLVVEIANASSLAGPGFVQIVGPVQEVLLDGGRVSIKTTWRGDITQDGAVDVGDLGVLAAHWGQSDATWTTGDLSFDARVDVSDLGILAAWWGSASAVPEPAMTALLLAGLTAVLSRPRRRGGSPLSTAPRAAAGR